MLDNIGLAVSNLMRSRRFYFVALAPLSLGIVMEVTKEPTGKYAGTGFGANNKPFFWIGTGDHLSGPVHVAFTASRRRQFPATRLGLFNPVAQLVRGRAVASASSSIFMSAARSKV
jgi:hypothetical protein